MTHNEFENELKNVYSNYNGINFTGELLAQLWQDFKQITPQHWKSICWDIIQNVERRPVIADFYNTIKNISNCDNSRGELTECRQCGKDYDKPNWQADYDDWCISCLKWRDTQEGQAEIQMNRKKLLQSINKFERGHRMVKNTDDVPF